MLNAPEKRVVIGGPNNFSDTDTKVSIAEADKLDIVNLVGEIFGAPKVEPRKTKTEEDYAWIDELSDEKLREFKCDTKADLKRKMKELDEFLNSRRTNESVKSADIHKKDVMRYVNAFFRAGFDNNIMNPSKSYWRLSVTGNVAQLKTKLRKVKAELK